MKVVLFCGGLGTRIREYSEHVPKPMIPVGSRPVLWHIMDYYSRYGHRVPGPAVGHPASGLGAAVTADASCMAAGPVHLWESGMATGATAVRAKRP